MDVLVTTRDGRGVLTSHGASMHEPRLYSLVQHQSLVIQRGFQLAWYTSIPYFIDLRFIGYHIFINL